jgi:hypothetical protein
VRRRLSGYRDRELSDEGRLAEPAPADALRRYLEQDRRLPKAALCRQTREPALDPMPFVCAYLAD